MQSGAFAGRQCVEQMILMGTVPYPAWTPRAWDHNDVVCRFATFPEYMKACQIQNTIIPNKTPKTVSPLLPRIATLRAPASTGLRFFAR